MGNANGSYSIQRLICLCVIPVVMLLAACGGGHGGSITSALDGETATVYPAADVLPADLPQPDGVDAAVWEELTATLRGMSVSRLTAGAPRTEVNAVDDLEATRDGEIWRFTWTYMNSGDYDLNGLVNASDLTPIGLHYGKNGSSPDWVEAHVADGNHDAEIGIGDITPIGQGYLNRVDGYELQRSADATGPWETVAAVVFADGVIPVVGFNQVFTLELPSITGDNYYQVTPYYDDPESGDRLAGITGVPILVEGDRRGDWWMEGRDNRHSCFSSLPGPTTSHLWWTLSVGSAGTMPVFDGEENIYIGSGWGLNVIPLDGESHWTWHADSNILTTPALARDGTVYFGTYGGMFYALGPDRRLKWSFQANSAITGSPAVGPDGSVWFGAEDDALYGLDSAGNLIDSYPVDGLASYQELHSPVIASDGTVIYSFGLSQIIWRPESGFTEEVARNAWPTLLDVPYYSADQGTTQNLESYLVRISEGWFAYPVNQPAEESLEYTLLYSGDYNLEGSQPARGPGNSLYMLGTYNPLIKIEVAESADNQASLLWELGVNEPPAVNTHAVVVDVDGRAYCEDIVATRLQVVNPDGTQLCTFPVYPEAGAVIGPRNTLLVRRQGTLYVFGGPRNGQLPDAIGTVTTERFDKPYEIGLRIPRANGADGYEIYRDDATEPLIYCPSYIQDSYYVRDGDVEPGREYEYRIRPYNSVGAGDLCDAIVGATELNRPEDFTASDAEYPDRVVLAWTRSLNATGYEIYRDSTYGDEPLAVVGDVDTWDDTAVPDWNYHSYYIRATNDLTIGEFQSASGRLQPGTGDPGPGDWRMNGRDNGRSRLSTLTGPETATVAWTYTSSLAYYYNFQTGEVLSGSLGSLFVSPGSYYRYNMQVLNPDGTDLFGTFHDGTSELLLLDDGSIAVTGSQSCLISYSNGLVKADVPTVSPAGLRLLPDGSLLSTEQNRLVSFNEDQTLNWYYDVTPLTPVGETTILSPDGTIFTAVNTEVGDPWRMTYRTMPWEYPVAIHCIESTGTNRWTIGPIDGYCAMLTNLDDRIYLVTATQVQCLDTADGGELWSYAATGMPALGPDGAVCLVASDRVTAVNAGGSLKFSRPLTTGYTACRAPAVDAAGHIYFQELDVENEMANVVALNPDGSLLWEYATSCTALNAPPSIGNDGTLYCAFEGNDDDYDLIAFSAD